jgi:hypothetical protein
MDENKQKMIDKILKLLELGSEKNPNEHERNLAADTAAKLMAKYSIEFIDLKNGKPKEEIFGNEYVKGMSAKYFTWEGDLATYIIGAFDGKIVFRNYLDGTWSACFIGTKSDVEIATFFFKYLRRTVGKAADGYSRLKKERETFATGMVMQIGKRLNDLYKKREEFIPSDCKDLVVIKKEGVTDYMKKLFPHVRTGKANRPSGSREAWAKGAQAGQKVNLSRPIGNNSHQGYIGG